MPARPLATFSFREASRPASTVPWPSISWAYSLVLPIALLLLLATLIGVGRGPDVLVIHVTSAVSGDAMPGTLVTVGDRAYLTDNHGEVRIERPPEGTDIGAQADGFAEVEAPLIGSRDVQMIQMQPALVSGVVKDAVTGEPVAGADVTLIDRGGQPVATLRTDSRGAYIFKTVPSDATIHVEAPGFAKNDMPVESRHQVDIEMASSLPYKVGSQVAEMARSVGNTLPDAFKGGSRRV